jgi:hypothetical protein
MQRTMRWPHLGPAGCPTDPEHPLGFLWRWSQPASVAKSDWRKRHKRHKSALRRADCSWQSTNRRPQSLTYSCRPRSGNRARSVRYITAPISWCCGQPNAPSRRRLAQQVQPSGRARILASPGRHGSSPSIPHQCWPFLPVRERAGEQRHRPRIRSRYRAEPPWGTNGERSGRSARGVLNRKLR